MKPVFFLSLGVVGVLVGLGFVFPAIAQRRDLGFIPMGSIALLLLGRAMALGGLCAGVDAVRRLRS